MSRSNTPTEKLEDVPKSQSETPSAEKPPPPALTFPDGGTRAWANVLGCFLLSFTSYGQLNAFGVFQTYYVEVLLKTHSPSEISWIGSIQLVLSYISGLFLGRVFDIYGARRLLVSGWLLSTFALMMTSISTKYYQIFLSHGVALGIGIALQFYPLLVVPSHWFRVKRAAALGIVVSGSSLSGIIFPIMLSRLINQIGFPWTVRAFAFMIFGLQALAIPLVKERLPHRLGLPVVDLQAFREPVFFIYAMSGFIISFALYTPFWYIELYSLQQGLTADLSFYMISIMNTASLFGRVLTGYVADSMGRFNTLVIVVLVSGISSLAIWITSHHSVAGIVVFSIIFGFTSSSFSSIGTACTAQITPEQSRIGARTGMFMTAMAPGILTGPSIAGAILGHDRGDYLGLQIFVGVMLIVGAGVAWIAKLRASPGVFSKF